MNKSPWLIFALAGLALAGCSHKALNSTANGLKLTMHTTIVRSNQSSMSPALQAAMNRNMDTTTYIGDNEVRIDTAGSTMIFDTASKKMTFLNNSAKTYYTVDYHSMAGGAAATHTNVVDTGKSTTLLGHQVRRYTMTNQIPMGNGATISMRSDILAADDLPPAQMATIRAWTSREPASTHIDGLPLATTIVMTGGPTGDITIKQAASALSEEPLPASLFVVPSGYRQTTAPASQLTSLRIPRTRVARRRNRAGF